MPRGEKEYRAEMTFSFRWWRWDGGLILPPDKERLKAAAWERMAQLGARGNTCGELLEEIDGISYRGWWDKTQED